MKYRNKQTGEIVEANEYYDSFYRQPMMAYTTTNRFGGFDSMGVTVPSFHAQYEPVEEDE